jgi:hypothetical protein
VTRREIRAGSIRVSVRAMGASHRCFGWNRHGAGLQALAQRTGADETMIATIMHGYPDRLRSYELIADACLPRDSVQVGNTPEDSPSTDGVGELRNR